MDTTICPQPFEMYTVKRAYFRRYQLEQKLKKGR